MMSSSSPRTGGTWFVVRTRGNTSSNPTANTSPRSARGPTRPTRPGCGMVQYGRRPTTSSRGSRTWSVEARMDELNEDDVLSNQCGDLVSLTRLEPAIGSLFGEKAAGAWGSVRYLYAKAGQANDSIKAGVVAAWLPTPSGDPDSAVVLFYDEESVWSMTAWYNVGLLREKYPAGVVG